LTIHADWSSITSIIGQGYTRTEAPTNRGVASMGVGGTYSMLSIGAPQVSPFRNFGMVKRTKKEKRGRRRKREKRGGEK